MTQTSGITDKCGNEDPPTDLGQLLCGVRPIGRVATPAQSLALPSERAEPAPSEKKTSLYLCEAEHVARDEPDMFAGLSAEERRHVLDAGAVRQLRPGETLFRQGDLYEGLYVILTGVVRVYYTGPSGREITLAYWSPGNFVGGPEVFGESPHMWSGAAARPAQVLRLHGRDLRRLMKAIPGFGVNLVDALAHKGRCYSALVHMLGTRSVTERLAELLLTMTNDAGARARGGKLLGRPLTHEELAKLVGSTRQWVSMTLERFRREGLIGVRGHRMVVCDADRLREYIG